VVNLVMLVGEFNDASVKRGRVRDDDRNDDDDEGVDGEENAMLDV
jgi:hypothetical protein